MRIVDSRQFCNEQFPLVPDSDKFGIVCAKQCRQTLQGIQIAVGIGISQAACRSMRPSVTKGLRLFQPVPRGNRPAVDVGQFIPILIHEPQQCSKIQLVQSRHLPLLQILLLLEGELLDDMRCPPVMREAGQLLSKHDEALARKQIEGALVH
ncbi:MAG: hypothetical protein Q8M11_06770 [Sulfuritalea sp.]|nr:hypothetical protein [Sulfuritalea sp.]